MSKKHFIALADAIREWNAVYKEQGFTPFQIDRLALFCEKQNSNFKRERWLGYIAGTNGKNGGAR
jgi:hypothetical protein